MEKIILHALREDVKDFLAMPQGPLKNLKHQKMSGSSIFESSIVYKDDCMYYGATSFNLSKSKYGYFLKAFTKDGFTLDSKGKLKIWFNKTPKKLPFIDKVIKAIGNDWYISDYNFFLTKGILEKILNKKVTNPLGFCEAWLKAQRIKASPRLLFKVLSKGNVIATQNMILKYQNIFEHMDQFLELLIKHKDDEGNQFLTGNFIDMCDQAVLLETKVDPYWSHKRVEIEHHRMTQEIMQLQLEEVDNTVIKGLEPVANYLTDNPYIKLLDNERAVFMEGKMMSHCIYTNYWKRIDSKSILCMHVDYLGHKGTLTLERNVRKQYRVYDFRDKYNAQPNQLARDYVDNWLIAFNEYISSLQVEILSEYREVADFEIQQALPW